MLSKETGKKLLDRLQLRIVRYAIPSVEINQDFLTVELSSLKTIIDSAITLNDSNVNEDERVGRITNFFDEIYCIECEAPCGKFTSEELEENT